MLELEIAIRGREKKLCFCDLSVHENDKFKIPAIHKHMSIPHIISYIYKNNNNINEKPSERLNGNLKCSTIPFLEQEAPNKKQLLNKNDSYNEATTTLPCSCVSCLGGLY